MLISGEFDLIVLSDTIWNSYSSKEIVLNSQLICYGNRTLKNDDLLDITKLKLQNVALLLLRE